MNCCLRSGKLVKALQSGIFPLIANRIGLALVNTTAKEKNPTTTKLESCGRFWMRTNHDWNPHYDPNVWLDVF